MLLNLKDDECTRVVLRKVGDCVTPAFGLSDGRTLGVGGSPRVEALDRAIIPIYVYTEMEPSAGPCEERRLLWYCNRVGATICLHCGVLLE